MRPNPVQRERQKGTVVGHVQLKEIKFHFYRVRLDDGTEQIVPERRLCPIGVVEGLAEMAALA